VSTELQHLLLATPFSVLLTHYVEVLTVHKILGGLYLLFLAFKAGRASLNPDEQATAGARTTPSSRTALFRQGLLMHLGNPKSVLAWIALVTLGLGTDPSWHRVAMMLGGCALLSVTIFCGYAVLFSTTPMVRLYRRARRRIEGALAVVFESAGLRLLLAHT
jgi:threonine efflux protein